MSVVMGVLWELCPFGRLTAGHAAGAPRANTTFFCTGDNTWCYLYGTAQGTYAAAQTACQNSGGALVVYSGKQEQLLVEQYFHSKTGGGCISGG
jgi:hypothetical protein